MTSETTTDKRLLCPACGKKGWRVSPVTLRALVRDEYRETVPNEGGHRCESEAVGCKAVTDDTGWRFCDSPDCDIVYFAEQGDTTFRRSALRVPVGVKETTGERPLCYCFGHSVGSIKDELGTKGRSDALSDIRRKMNQPGCRCETENPSGSCCLGSVAKGIQIAREELGMNVPEVDPDPVQTTDEVPSSLSRSQLDTGRAERIAKVGTLASAILASSCCWLPLVLLAVGVSGASVAAALEVYRPLFIVVTFGFLAAAFYFTYRPKKAAQIAGHACCGPEAMAGVEAMADCCAPSSKRRQRMMAVNIIMLWVVTMLAVAFLFFPSYVGLRFSTQVNGVVTDNMNRTVFEIEGMTCEGCARSVAQAIRQVPGVVAVKVGYENKQAVVGTEACCPVPKDKILATLKKAGYSSTVLGEGDAQNDANDTSNNSASAETRPDQVSLSTTALSVSGMT